MVTTDIHPAEAYLRNTENPPTLYVRIYGKRRRLFINRGENEIGIIAQGKRKSGYLFSDWQAIEKIYYPKAGEETDKERRLVMKYKRLASRATHTNDWLRRIAAADPEKSLYENHLTTGTRIDGMCISLSRIEKYCGSADMVLFRKALKEGRTFSSGRFDFCGYDGSLWCEPDGEGGMKAGFSKEYRGYLNGYYYLLINDEYVIGYDVD